MLERPKERLTQTQGARERSGELRSLLNFTYNGTRRERRRAYTHTVYQF